MVSSKVLAAMEFHACNEANNGECSECEWGNIPIIIMVGDDYQLPPIEPGMAHAMEKDYVEKVLGA